MNDTTAKESRATTRTEGHFVRGMGLFDSTMLVMGVMIGSGIYLVTPDIARVVGSGGWMLVVWIVTTVLTVLAANSYGELSAMMPEAGGQYVFLREAFGRMTGFLYGWTLFVVIQTGSIAAVGVAFAKFTGVLFPGVSATNVLVDVGDIPWFGVIPWFGEGCAEKLHIAINAQQLVGIGVIAFLTAANMRGLSAGRLVQNVFTVVKVGTLILLIVIGLMFFKGDGAIASAGFWDARPADGRAIITAIGVAMTGSLFAADAWNNITFTAGEVRDPERTLPRSLVLGAAGVMGIYLLANVAYVAVLSFGQVANPPDDRIAAAMMNSIFGDAGATIMAVAIMISTFGCLNGMILAGPRLTYAMARDDIFFKAAGHLGVKSGVPERGLIMQGAWAALLTLSGTYGDLLDYVIFAALLFYVLTVLAVIVLRTTRPEAKRPYKAWGYPFLPVLYIIAALAVIGILFFEKPQYTRPSLLLVATGIPVYFIWRARALRAAKQPPVSSQG